MGRRSPDWQRRWGDRLGSGAPLAAMCDPQYDEGMSHRRSAISTERRRKPVALSTIRAWAQKIGARFHPEKIILFGSRAYGRPTEDSDVDILVVMPTANEISQSIRLTLALEPPFPLDLIVRTPKNLRRGLEDGDSFLREIVTKGKVLYAETDCSVGPQGRGRLQGSRRAGSGTACAE